MQRIRAASDFWQPINSRYVKIRWLPVRDAIKHNKSAMTVKEVPTLFIHFYASMTKCNGLANNKLVLRIDGNSDLSKDWCSQ